MARLENLEWIRIADACRDCGIDDKAIDNFWRYGHELTMTKNGSRNGFLRNDLDTWYRQYQFSSVTLDRDDYMKCLKFAIRSYYDYRSRGDFGTAQQRDAGKFISNFVSGKLGEIAVEKFFKNRFDIDTRLDFEIREAVIGQDITEVAFPRRGARVFNPPRVRIAIKTTKAKNVYLAVPANEAEDDARRSDVYILSRVDLYLNHFLRILREHRSLEEMTDIIPEFVNIRGQVCGFILLPQLLANVPVTELAGMGQSIQSSYVSRSGALQKTEDQWRALFDTF